MGKTKDLSSDEEMILGTIFHVLENERQIYVKIEIFISFFVLSISSLGLVNPVRCAFWCERQRHIDFYGALQESVSRKI